MSRSVSAIVADGDCKSQLKSNDRDRNIENNKQGYEHIKKHIENFGKEITSVTVCLQDCRKCAGFYTDVTEKYLLTCLCPCHKGALM